MLKRLIYLHGFRSSPHSYKAQYLANIFRTRYQDVQWVCPQLPPSPAGAARLMLELTKEWEPESSAVVGSSLGGFYAAWLANEAGFRCALINPATDPASDLKHYIGQQTTWQNPSKSFYFKEEYLDELKKLYPTAQSKASIPKLLMACTGDEVLDWRAMVATHANATQHIVEGSDHAMSDFDQHVSVLLDFLGL